MAVSTNPLVTGIPPFTYSASSLVYNSASIIASATSATWDALDITPSLSVTGSTAITTAAGVNMMTLRAPAIASAANITNASTLSILGAPTISGGGSITNAYALWVQAGVSRFGGAIQAADAGYVFANATTSGLYLGAANSPYMKANNVEATRWTSGSVILANGFLLQFSQAAGIGGAATNPVFQCGGDGVVELRQSTGTNGPATFRIFNTRTDASNGEWLEHGWTSNTAYIGSKANGTGTARIFRLMFGGTGTPAIDIPTAMASAIEIGGGSSSATGDETRVSIGGAGSTPSTVFSSTSGRKTLLGFQWDFAPSSSSTMDARYLEIGGTINYASGGAGRVQLIRLAPTNTALPTGLNAAMVLSATASALGGIHWHNQTDETTNNEYVSSGFVSNIWRIASFANGTGTLRGLQFGIAGNTIGFYGATPVAQQTGVAVTAAGIHAALVNLGLITA